MIEMMLGKLLAFTETEYDWNTGFVWFELYFLIFRVKTLENQDNPHNTI